MNENLITTDDGLKAIALAVARNKVGIDDPIEEILLAEGVDPLLFDKLLDDKVFQRYIKLYVKELTEAGMSFKMKNRVLVEDAIAHVYNIIRDGEQPAMARIKGFETMAKYAGFDAEIAAETPQNAQFHITFNVPSLPDARQLAAAITVSGQQKPALEADFSVVASENEHEAAIYAE